MYAELVAIDSFTVSLHSPNGRHLPAIRAMQGDCQWPWKMVEIPTGHVSPEFIATEAFPNLYLDYPTTKGQHQPIGSHVPYPTDSPTATRLGLCSSLVSVGFCWIWLTLVVFISINNVLIHQGFNKMAAIWQVTFSYLFFGERKVLCFDWNVFLNIDK